MKKKLLKISLLILSFFMFLQVQTYAYGESYNENVINIDGHFDDWADKPVTDVKYDWDSKAAHKVSLFRDSKYVYIYVKMSDEYYSQFNGYNYNFKFNNDNYVSYAIVYDKGDINSLDKGTYKLTVRTQNGYEPVGEGYLVRKASNPSEVGMPDEMEARIPLSSFQEGIDVNSIKSIAFNTPNLGPQWVHCAGTSSGPYIAVGLGAIIVLYAVKKNMKKRVRV